MAAVQLQKLGFHQFGGVVVPGNTDCLSGCADGFQHKVNNLVQTVFVNFAVLNEMVVFDIVLATKIGSEVVYFDKQVFNAS